MLAPQERNRLRPLSVVRVLHACALLAVLFSCACANRPATDGGGCTTPFAVCGAECVDLSSSARNCGGCGRTCPGSQICSQSSCVDQCGRGMTLCDLRCVITDEDRRNCGACDNVCPSGQDCVTGRCRGSCDGGLTLCSTACVAIATDPSNCGSCGRTCAGFEICAGGVCGGVCTGGLTSCNGACVDLAANGRNCGRCNNVCGVDRICAGGACQLNCVAPRIACGTACVNPTTDPANCGTCGNACGASEVCTASVCTCRAGFTRCGGACVETATHASHCGRCDNACASGLICSASACVRAPSQWRTLGGDAQHSGFNPTEQGIPPLSRAWGVSVALDVLQPVVIEDGRVFATAAAHDTTISELTALEATTGRVLWRHDFGAVHSLGQPAVMSGRVFVAQTEGPSIRANNMWAFEAATGTLAWRALFESQRNDYWAPIVVADRVYSNGGFGGGLIGFDVMDGRQVFANRMLEAYDRWSPGFANATLYSFTAGYLRSHDPATGAITSALRVPWPAGTTSMQTSPVFGATLAYVIASGSVHALDPATRMITWTTPGAFTSMPAVASDSVYAIDGNRLAVLDAATGAARWTFAGDSMLNHPPVIAGNFVYVSSDSNVYAVDRTTHAQVWTAAQGGWLSIGAGHLFVAGPIGTLTAYALSP